MNKAALFATIAMLPVFAFAPLQSEQPTKAETSNKEVKPLKEPLKVGEKFPLISVEDAAGGTHDLAALLEDGPVVLTFFRGSWCPYCRGELSSVQSRLKKISDAGAQVLAISPEEQERTEELVEQKKYGFLFGTDHNNELAKQLALAFKLDAKTIKAYRQYGIDVPESNGTKRWELPIPATYVIDTDRTIRFAFVDEDYSKRADYDKVVEVLKEIQNED